MDGNNSLLIRALCLNAGFSAVSAVCMLLAADWVAAQVGLPGPANVYAVGIFLLLFALQLANIVRSGRIRTWEIVAIILGDLLWVAASIVLGSLYFRRFTAVGAVMIDAVALAVLLFAVLQMRGLARHLRPGRPHSGGSGA